MDTKQCLGKVGRWDAAGGKGLKEESSFFELLLEYSSGVCSWKMNIYGLEFSRQFKNTDRNFGVIGIEV